MPLPRGAAGAGGAHASASTGPSISAPGRLRCLSGQPAQAANQFIARGALGRRGRPVAGECLLGSIDGGIDLFVAGDQLLKGAALNAVQIAELLGRRHLKKG